MTALPVASSGSTTVVGSYHPTTVGMPMSKKVAPPLGGRDAPWSLPTEYATDNPAATTTFVPELGVWAAVLDLQVTRLNQVSELGDLAAAGVATDLLDRADLREISRYPAGQQQVRVAVARVLLRRLLTDRVDLATPPRAWRFTRTGSGRLCLRGGTGLSGLAVAYGPDVVVAAIGVRPIGVEIEAEPSPDIIADLLGYSTELITPEERRWLAGLPPALVREDLARLWTLKRAAATALGVEVLLDLGLIRARLSPPSVRVDLGLSRSPVGCAQWPVTIAGSRRWVAIASAETD